GRPPAGRYRRAPGRWLRPPDLAGRRSPAPLPRARVQQGAGHRRPPLAVAGWPRAVRLPEGGGDALQGRAPGRAHPAARGGLDRVLDRTFTLRRPPDLERVLEAARLRLEDSAATWGRAQAVEVLSTLITGGDAEGARRAIEGAADALLAQGEVVCLAGPLPA